MKGNYQEINFNLQSLASGELNSSGHFFNSSSAGFICGFNNYLFLYWACGSGGIPLYPTAVLPVGSINKI
ncbi:MAG: hypothetical protein ABIW47_06415 [Ginsengibacter sp.]